jgi:HNH endonuclease
LDGGISGETSEDPRPEGGGGFNEKEIGHEAWNFLPINGECYGYAETGAKEHGFNLRRIEPRASSESLSDVLLVFLANIPHDTSYKVREDLPQEIGKGIRIVGWHRNCTIFSASRPISPEYRKLRSENFNAKCAVGDAILIPQAQRKTEIDLSGPGGMLRTNVRYVYGDDGQFKTYPWTEKALAFIDGYQTDLPLPEEIVDPEQYIEGARTKIVVNAYERDLQARAKCIQIYGYKCSVCEFDFESTYGKHGREYIQVHHLKSLASIGVAYKVNPKNDLRPVCPNCHAMIHRRKPMLTIEELQGILRKEQL